jgi:hypothetical protein
VVEVGSSVSTVVLVEGESDRSALEALAGRRGRSLDAEGVAVVSMGGARSIRRFAESLGVRGRGLRLGGLVDVNELGDFSRGLGRAGYEEGLDRAGLERLGFFVCDRDLEDELIRALGVDVVVALIEEQGELASLRSLQQQPAQRGRSVDQQLRRFMGSKGGRKIGYAPLLVGALDLDRVPEPLDRLLAWLEGEEAPLRGGRR